MKFKIGKYWWTRDGIELKKIVSKTTNSVKATSIGSGYTMNYTLQGTLKFGVHDDRDLMIEETDSRIILKYYIDPENTFGPRSKGCLLDSENNYRKEYEPEQI